MTALAGADNYFEDFAAGDRIRHARGTTVGEIENQLLSKLVLNSAQAHFNDHVMASTPFGRRLMFGLVTASIVIGLASQDTAEHAIAELGLTGLRFRAPVFHGDTLYAYTEVLDTRAAHDRRDAGIARLRHIGTNQDGVLVFEGERTVLLQRRTDTT